MVRDSEPFYGFEIKIRIKENKFSFEYLCVVDKREIKLNLNVWYNCIITRAGILILRLHKTLSGQRMKEAVLDLSTTVGGT